MPSAKAAHAGMAYADWKPVSTIVTKPKKARM